MNHLIQWDTKIDMLLIIYLILYFPSSYFQTGITLGGYYLYINISHMGVMPQVILGEEKTTVYWDDLQCFYQAQTCFFTVRLVPYYLIIITLLYIMSVF